MWTVRIGAALGLVGVLATIAYAPSVSAQANCDWYAKTALRQQQENEQKKCNLKGPEWNSDLKAHMTWCATVPPDAWKAQAQKRDQALAACAKKP
jgi:hypothetical protein